MQISRVLAQERRLLRFSFRPATHCLAGGNSSPAREWGGPVFWSLPSLQGHELCEWWSRCFLDPKLCAPQGECYSWPHAHQLHFGKLPQVLVHRIAGKMTAQGPHEGHSWKISPLSLLPLLENFLLWVVAANAGGSIPSDISFCLFLFKFGRDLLDAATIHLLSNDSGWALDMSFQTFSWLHTPRICWGSAGLNRRRSGKALFLC